MHFPNHPGLTERFYLHSATIRMKVFVEVTMAVDAVDLVTVLETNDSFALTLAKSALEDAGIKYVVGEDNPKPLGGFPGNFGLGETPLGTVCSSTIQVDRAFEGEARGLLEPLKNPVEPEIEET
jgi:hypothetical protein